MEDIAPPCNLPVTATKGSVTRQRASTKEQTLSFLYETSFYHAGSHKRTHASVPMQTLRSVRVHALRTRGYFPDVFHNGCLTSHCTKDHLLALQKETEEHNHEGQGRQGRPRGRHINKTLFVANNTYKKTRCTVEQSTRATSHASAQTARWGSTRDTGRCQPTVGRLGPLGRPRLESRRISIISPHTTTGTFATNTSRSHFTYNISKPTHSTKSSAHRLH